MLVFNDNNIGQWVHHIDVSGLGPLMGGGGGGVPDVACRFLKSPMSPVYFKKRQCRTVEFKGEGPQGWLVCGTGQLQTVTCMIYVGQS